MNKKDNVKLSKKVKSLVSILCVVGILVNTLYVGVFYSWAKKYFACDDPLNMENFCVGEYDGEADYDEDGITNDEENKLGTNIYSVDSDCDGLNDKYEIDDSKTDPTKKDTDEDTLSDYAELLAGLNPLEKKSDGKTNDKDRTFDEEYKQNDVRVSLSGNAEIYNTYIGEFNVAGLSRTPGVMSEAYEICSEKSLKNSKITFSYDEQVVKNRGGSVENLSIYTFEGDGTFKKVNNCTIDKENRTVSTDISFSAKYLLCDSASINSDHETKIMLLIDNSGSMFPKELCVGSNENDVDFKRLDMAKSIIENIDDKVEYGLGKFTGTYTNLADIGTSKEKLFEKIDGIRDIEENFDGTFIATSIIESLKNFSDDYKNDRKFIIILTDGESTEGSGWFSRDYDENDAIKYCDEKNVAVITIGMGNSVGTSYLQKIADQTGGAYIYANNADALETLYEKIFTQLVYSSEDIDDNGTADTYIIADSGFTMEKDAFSFENFCALVPNNSIRQDGVCYGMAVLAQGFYQNRFIGEANAFSAKWKHKVHYSISGFDITDILSKYKNLRDYENSIMSKYTEFYSLPATQKYIYEDGTLYLTSFVKEKYGNKYIKYEMSSGNGKWMGKKYKQYEQPYIDIEGYMASGEKNDEMELICSLYWLWAQQIENRGLYKSNYYALENDFGAVGDAASYSKIVEKISAGIPLVVNYTYKDFCHSINAIRILRDIDEPNVYYVECYDNNNCSETVLFKVVQQKMNFWHHTSVSNWGKTFAVTPYINDNGSWQNISLEFEEIVFKN